MCMSPSLAPVSRSTWSGYLQSLLTDQGPAGLGAIKAMLDEGFNVTGFERRPDAGGLWAFSENPQFTSATESTKAQLSKFMVSTGALDAEGHRLR